MSRVSINLVPDNEKKAASKGLKTSSFLLSINPNISYNDPNIPEARELAMDLKDTADFLLKKNVIKKILRFDNIEGTEEKTLQEHLAAIESIDEDRSGSIEFGGTTRKLHMHLYFTIRHRTHVKIDRDKVAKITSEFLNVDPSRLNISFNVMGKNQFLDYVKKYNPTNPQS